MRPSFGLQVENYSNRAIILSMIIFPECEIKILGECKPGEIVRIIQPHAAGQFALIASVVDSDGRALILVQEVAPAYVIIDDPKRYRVLSYPGELQLEVDQEGPFEPPVRRLYEMNGCLLRTCDSWRMNVQSAVGGGRRDQGQYDLNRAELANPRYDVNDVAIFGNWALYFGPPGAPREERLKIASFECMAADG